MSTGKRGSNQINTSDISLGGAMRLSTAGAKLIEEFEDFSAKPYQDVVGVWTIGYGSTKGVGPDTPPVTREQAQARLMHEVEADYGAAINDLHLPLNQNQFDALVSFVYNEGPGAVGPSTSPGRALRAHDWQAAADALLLYDVADNRVLPGLEARRRRERALFLTPVREADGSRAAATPPDRRHVHEQDGPRQRTSVALTPAQLAAAGDNGHVPESLLAHVPGGRLRLDAAAAFNAMNEQSEREYGLTLRSEGPLGTYRTVPEQQQLYDVYQNGGALAAVPGTSNHGLGRAIDLGTQQMRHIVDEIGAPFGWAKRWSDAPTEWWHLRYRPGIWKPAPDAPPRPSVVTRTEATAIVQQLLRVHGFSTVPVDGLAGAATVAALRWFQREHRLTATGGLDRATVAALRRAAPRTAPNLPGRRSDDPLRPHDPSTSHDPTPHNPPQPHPHPRRRPQPRRPVSAAGFTVAERAAARSIIVEGCRWMVSNKDRVNYTEGPERWEAITQRLRIVEGRYLTYGDCSSTATWLLWNGLTHINPQMPDIVNGEDWRPGGVTGTIAQHGMLVQEDALRVGDLILYGPPPAYEHVTVALGGGMCFSHGGQAGPFKCIINYRPDRGPARRFL